LARDRRPGTAGPGTSGDGDGDGRADLNDFNEFAACLMEPGNGLGTDCAGADLDTDHDVDLEDLRLFHLAFTGPLSFGGRLPRPSRAVQASRGARRSGRAIDVAAGCPAMSVTSSPQSAHRCPVPRRTNQR